MPGFNKRGPEGMGPMSGGGRGFCNPSNRSSFGRGSSFNAGRGRGRGSGYNRNREMGGWTENSYAGSPYLNSTQEEKSLRNEVSALKNELAAVENKLQELKDTEKTDK